MIFGVMTWSSVAEEEACRSRRVERRRGAFMEVEVVLWVLLLLLLAESARRLRAIDSCALLVNLCSLSLTDVQDKSSEMLNLVIGIDA